MEALQGDRKQMYRRQVTGHRRASTRQDYRFSAVTARRNKESDSYSTRKWAFRCHGYLVFKVNHFQKFNEAGFYTRRPMVYIPLSVSHKTAGLNVVFTDVSRISANNDSTFFKYGDDQGRGTIPRTLRKYTLLRWWCLGLTQSDVGRTHTSTRLSGRHPDCSEV